MHDWIGAALDSNRRRLLMNHTAQRLHRRSLAQRQVQGMDVAAAHVEHAADILITGHHLMNAALVHQFQLGVPVSLPELLLRFQMAHLLVGDGCKHAAILQVALNLILGHPITNDRGTFKCHLTQQLRLLGPDSAFDHVDVAAIAVDDLSAITPRCTKADFGSLKHRHTKSVLQQK